MSTSARPLPLLKVKDLQIDFISELGTTTAVHKLDFEVCKGETLAIVGESGSGKSVTSLSILRLIPDKTVRYTQGAIYFSDTDQGEVDLLKLTESQLCKIRGRKIAMIFQEPMTSLNPVLTCGEQLIETVQAHFPVSLDDARKKAIRLFEKVKLPDPESIFRRYPHQLSGGQKQRVMIAIAMSCDPSLLICDEPTTALDVTVQKSILALLKELQQESGMAIIFITHDLGIVNEIADHILVMNKGEVMEKGSALSVFTDPKATYTKGLLACRPLLYSKGQRLPLVSDFNKGVPSTAPVAEIFQPNGDLHLSVQNLRVSYVNKRNIWGRALSYHHAVNDVSFDIYRGETIGLVGESGCGKTTLGRAILQLIPTSSGSVIFERTMLHQLAENEMRSFRTKMQLVFQDPMASLNPKITIGEALMEPLKVHTPHASHETYQSTVFHWLDKVGLSRDMFHRYPHELSGGQKQRIVIARALLLHPTFLVCDESVAALDVSMQAQILNLLNDLKKELNFTILFISHDLSVVHYFCDRILVMKEGKIVEEGLSDQVFHAPHHPYTRSLLDAIPGKNQIFN